jgi:hypothetical protein
VNNRKNGPQTFQGISQINEPTADVSKKKENSDDPNYEDRGPTQFEKDFDDAFVDRLVISPLVDQTISFLGIQNQILGQEQVEEGLRSVFQEIKEEGLLILWDRRLQIEIRDHDCKLVWAYCPIYQHKWIAEYVDLRLTTQVLLVISATRAEYRTTALFEKILRHQIGHVLRYLQHPTWPNECHHATREWKKWS